MKKIYLLAFLGFIIIGVYLFLIKNNKEVRQMPENITKTNLKLTSSAFLNNEKIPKQYTCDGGNISPPLTISGITPKAKSLVLIVDDPDAPFGVFTHWLIWNISPQVNEIKENILPLNVGQGKNNFGNNKYDGPCNPKGSTHRYIFKLFVLDISLDLEQGITREVLLQSMQEHILEQTELIGTYQRNF